MKTNKTSSHSDKSKSTSKHSRSYSSKFTSQKSIHTYFDKLSPSQKLKLINELKSKIVDSTKILSIHQSNQKKISECYHCKNKNIVHFGSYSGKKRFRCKDCKKTFSELTGTSIYYIKKLNLWFKFIDLMVEGKTLREISSELKISVVTVFNWRHKILNSFTEVFTKRFKGIVETDDIYFRLNQKGRGENNRVTFDKKKRGISNQQVSVMVTSDRYKTIDMKIVKLGRITKRDLDRVMNQKRLNKDNIICSDKHRSITCFVKSLGLQHKKVDSSKKQYVNGIYHVQRVNNITSGFRTWLRGNFGNVSTKYLQNYLNLYQMLQVVKEKDGYKKNEQLLKYSLVDIRTIEKYTNREKKYLELLRY